MLPELTAPLVMAISVAFGAAIGLALPGDVDRLQACWSSLVGGLCLVTVLLQVAKWQQRRKEDLSPSLQGLPGGFRRATAADLDAIVRFTKETALETENTVLPDAGVRKGVSVALRNHGNGEGLVPRYWVWHLSSRDESSCTTDQDSGPQASMGMAACEKAPNIAGVVGISPEWSDWWGVEYWWIISVFVHKAHRRQGIATQLLKGVLSEAQRNGVQSVSLRVEKGNKNAQALYRSAGFDTDDSHMVMACGRTPSGEVVGDTAATKLKRQEAEGASKHPIVYTAR